MQDDDSTPEERAEAEALAHALSRGRDDAALPEDALETAALLRYARDGGALEERDAERILADVLREARPAKKPRTGLFRYRWPLLSVAAAAAVAVVFIRSAADSGIEAARLPSPPPTLIQTQLAAAGENAALAALEREMQDYRVSVYAALGGAYGR